MIASVFQQNANTYTIITENGSWGANIYCPLENTLKIFNEQGQQISSAYMPN